MTRSNDNVHCHSCNHFGVKETIPRDHKIYEFHSEVTKVTLVRSVVRFKYCIHSASSLLKSVQSLFLSKHHKSRHQTRPTGKPSRPIVRQNIDSVTCHTSDQEETTRRGNRLSRHPSCILTGQERHNSSNVIHCTDTMLYRSRLELGLDDIFRHVI